MGSRVRRDAPGHPGAGAGRPARPGPLDRTVRRLARPVALTAPRARGRDAEPPGEELAAIARREVSPVAWTERCHRLGIADLRLGDGFAGSP